jgi:diguanylate cyclase (GGDEF)-like protein
MQYGELIDFLQNVGKDPSRLIFEDELTGLHNRRFLLSYFEHKIHWDQDEHFPLSLLIVDVDLFKSINDTYGHDSGDQALAFVATLLKEVASDGGYPVRFGGDEFMLLLPRTELQRAVQQAHRLHQLTKERAFAVGDGRGEIHISLSIGVASARTDAASGNDLIRKADTALYASKKAGRNRVSVAREADPQKTAPKTALHRLDDTEIAGRAGELAAVSDALGSLSLGESKFLVIEGAPGMGKSTVIETVRRSLSGNAALSVVKIAGKRQEGFRPYYLVAGAAVALMNLRTDKGVPALDSLEPRELNFLGQVIPHLEDRSVPVEENERIRREGIFVALVKLVTRLTESRPLVLLIDDIHYADEGTLLLLKVLFARRDLRLFVCATVTETLSVAQEEETPPWDRFVSLYRDVLGIDKRQLQPLSAEDIARHLSGVFPGIDLPDGFERELARTTAGNPLFLGEIMRKLVLDQKLTLVGQRWTVEAPEDGYLPRSLEQIVNEKIAALDVESRKLLEQVSTLGEDVPLSMVTGATTISENEVLEFLDRAETLGLLRSDFQINDETMRFLSKRVLDIVYGSIQQARRRELHERVGTYHEELHQKRLGPSASILAYHFKRSANEEKASRYDQIQGDIRRRTFDRDEAEQYTGEMLLEEDAVASDDKLPPDALQYLPGLFRTLVTSVRSVQLYPADSKPIQKAYQTSFDAVAALLAVAEHVALARSQGVLLANGHKVDVGDFRLLANSYLELLDRAELESIEFRRGLGPDELKSLLTHLGQLKTELIDSTYWKSFAADQRLEHIALRQMRYSEVRRRGGRPAGGASGAAETALDAEELAFVPRVLRALMGAAKNSKLYPLGSRQVTSSIDHLLDELATILTRRRVLTLAHASGALLVNGARVTVTGFEVLAENFVSFLTDSALTSLTFLEQVSGEELSVFVGALKDLSTGLEPTFWSKLAKGNGLQFIAFNDRRYATSIVDSVLENVETDPDLDDSAEGSTLAGLVDASTEALIEALPTVGKDLLAKGDQALARKVIRRVFSDYAKQDVGVREKIIRSCRTLLEALIQALQHQFASIAADFLLTAFREEEDDHLLGELANILHQMTGSVLQYADFTLAGRIFAQLRERQRELMKTPRATGRGLAVLSRKIDSQVRSLLMEELQSRDPERQEKAALVLESMGKPSIPLLIEVIKQEKDFRTRQLAAGLLARMGRDAAERVKQEVVLEVAAEQRFRILEVIDVVTRDLKTELAFCLSDVNPKVRRAAFRLSERLNDKQVLEILVDFARHDDIGVAKGAIRSLASLRSAHAVGALVSTLEVTKDPERAIACAQALAQLGDPVAVPALEAVLVARKFPLLGRLRWDDQVRATAAFALAHIGGDRAKAALRRVAEDADPRIRQIAAHGISGAPRPTAPVDDTDEADNSRDEDEGEGEGEGEGVA